MSVQSQDFYSDTPPQRIFGLETEYSVPNKDENGDDKSEVAAEKVVSRVLAANGHRGYFLYNGSKAHTDVGKAEYATPECLGPVQAVSAAHAGQDIVADAAKDYAEESGRNNVKVYKRTGHINGPASISTGFHQNLATPEFVDETTRREDAAFIGTYAVSRVVWSGAGMVAETYQLSQKSHDISIEDKAALPFTGYGFRSEPGKKPILSWSRSGLTGGMAAHSTGFDRLEIRYADALNSPWGQVMSLATASLASRILEHRGQISPGFIGAHTFKKIGGAAHPISQNLDMSKVFDTVEGKTATAIDVQYDIAEQSLLLVEDGVQLPEEEITAAHELIRICDDLKDFNIDDIDKIVTLSDRLEWAARYFMLYKKLGGNAITNSNPEAAARDMAWDLIYPKPIAEIYWDKRQPELSDKIKKTAKSLQTSPPANTRAKARSKLLHKKPTRSVYGADWHVVITESPAGKKSYYRLSNPYTWTIPRPTAN